MITLFATPKPFSNLNAIIQKNAIHSWTLLDPKPEIILFGMSQGIEEVAKEFSVVHCPDVKCNEYGTPLVNDLFERAESLSNHDVLCYINADILLLQTFSFAVSSVSKRLHSFLLIGQRWDLDVLTAIDFDDNWQHFLVEKVSRSGKIHPRTGIDYFVYCKGLWRDGLPPFAIGRPVWDEWLVYRARFLDIPVIDATTATTVIHQNHDYSHVPLSRGAWNGPEADKNQELAGGDDYMCTIDDCTHRLIDGQIKRQLGWKYLHRRLKKFPALNPQHPLLSRILRSAFYRLSHQ